MKIALINNLYPPEGTGGAEHVIETHAEELISKGHDVIVITGTRTKKHDFFRNLKIIRYRPFNIYYYPDGHLYSFITRLIGNAIDLFNLISFFEIKRILKREQPHKAICHNLKGLGLFTPDALRSLSISFTLYLHDVQYSIPSGILLKKHERSFFNNGPFQKLYEAIVKSLLGSPNEVISPSQFLIDFYTKKGFFKHSKIIIDRIDWNRINVAVLQERFERFKQKVKNGVSVKVLYVGKIEEHKGIIELVKLWKNVPKHITLSVIGTGSKANVLKKISASNPSVSYLGKHSRKGLDTFYQKADILMLPTLCYENRPQVILEAYKNNLPVIAHAVGGIPEIIKHGKTGFLLKSVTRESILEILK